MKLPNSELKKLLSCIGKDPRVVVAPAPGYDSGVHKIGDKLLVVSTDPCTGVPAEWFGWFLINYASSDVALYGARPEFCTINLLAPLGTEPQVFEDAMRQTCEATGELGIAIVTGHTAMYGGVCQLIGVCTAYGTVEPTKLITPANAKAGDLILCTKPIGLENRNEFFSYPQGGCGAAFWSSNSHGTRSTGEDAKLRPRSPAASPNKRGPRDA
jgi:hydrogenase maturation factor